jgi:hypothetical protein
MVQIAAATDTQHAFVHRWHLHPLDVFTDVVDSILELLRECRVDRITVTEEIAEGLAPTAH